MTCRSISWVSIALLVTATAAFAADEPDEVSLSECWTWKLEKCSTA